MPKMTKRKALNNIDEENVMNTNNANREFSESVRGNSSIRISRGGASLNTTAPSDDSEFTAPTAFAEKRKKISNNFTDLSQLVDFKQTQFGDQTNRTKSTSGQNARLGTIEKIYLKNFKCHSMLEFNFHPYINFILGRNGSGKSAVMDSIILAFGGKATFTGRQASTKTFIKTNCDKAEVSITLKNEGEDAYKPGEYGSKITVERKISRDGQSLYRLLNENNKVVSTKKVELDNIIEQFNIQIDNPVCFLNQETSKHFLNSSNKSDKYKLFLKASQLDSMRKLQEEIELERQSSLKIIKEKESYMPRLEQELFQWEDKYKKCQSVEKLRQKMVLLMHEYSWSVVIAKERCIEAIMKDKRSCGKSKEKHEQKIDECEELLKKTSDEYEKAKKNINELTQMVKQCKAKDEQVATRFKQAQAAYRSTQNELKKIKLIIDKKNRDKAQLNEKLNEDKRTSRADYEEEKSQLKSKIGKTKGDLKELAAKVDAKTQECTQLAEEIDQNRKLVRDKGFEISDHETKIKNFEGDIVNLERAKNDQIYKFGDFMSNLVNDIKNYYSAGKFKQMPRGPIGMYVKPKSEEWSLAIEQCLGPLVNSFICGSFEDERTLHQLLSKHVSQVSRRPRVIVCDFNAPLYDVSKFRPENRNYKTVYEMLKIDDHIVANTLFDQRKIESILLLPDRNVGREVIEKNSTANCYEAFLKNGDQLLGRPSYKAYACRFKEANFFLKDTEETIKSKRREIQKHGDQLINLKNEIRSLNEQINSDTKAKNQLDKQLTDLRRAQIQLNNTLKDLESIQIPEPVDIAVFEDEIQKIEEEIAELNEQTRKINSESVETKQEFDNAKAELDQHESEMKKNIESIEELKNNFTQLEQDKTRQSENLKYYKNLYNEILAKENLLDQQIAKEKTELESLTKSAEENSPRIETNKTHDKIDKEIQLLEKQIQQTQKLHGNEEEITKKYLEMRSSYKKIKEDIKKQNKFLENLRMALEVRQGATTTFTEAKSLMCAMDFQKYLKSRNYSGQLKFNHEEQKLDIIVNPSRTQEGKETKDLKSLSGGERSFSTVAFLLALWSIVESPILFLDEFDVFMDQINRTYAMELIVSAAKEKLNGQYVFLTPQEMGTIQADNYVKMYKMPDPKRAIDMVSNIENEEN